MGIRTYREFTKYCVVEITDALNLEWYYTECKLCDAVGPNFSEPLKAMAQYEDNHFKEKHWKEGDNGMQDLRSHLRKE